MKTTILITLLVAIFTCSAEANERDSCRSMIPDSLQKVLKLKFPGYRLPLVKDNENYDIQYNLTHGGNGCLGVAVGDFDNDKNKDLGILLTAIKGDNNLLVVARKKGEAWKVDLLRDWGNRRNRLYVEAAKPGEYSRTEALEGPVTEPGEVEEFTSVSYGIVSGGIESSGVAYFLKGNEWIHVWISD